MVGATGTAGGRWPCHSLREEGGLQRGPRRQEPFGDSRRRDERGAQPGPSRDGGGGDGWTELLRSCRGEAGSMADGAAVCTCECACVSVCARRGSEGACRRREDAVSEASGVYLRAVQLWVIFPSIVCFPSVLH